jgi:N-acyl-D-amino-acid deacylase
VLRPGAFADVVVFSAEQIADVGTYADPHHYAVGVRHLLINGTPVLADGVLTHARPGRALRRLE